MSRKQLRARDKKVQKMSRDGVVERNAVTGEEKRISNRESRLDLRGGSLEHEAFSPSGKRSGNTKSRKKYANRQQKPASEAKQIEQQTIPLIYEDKTHDTTFINKCETEASAQGETINTENAPKATRTQYAKTRESFNPRTKVESPILSEPSPIQSGLEQAATDNPQERQGDKLKADKSGKLQFSKEETTSENPKDKPPAANSRLKKAEHQATRANEKLKKAQDKLPTQRQIRQTRVFDEKSGVAIQKFQFEKEVKTQAQHLKGALPLRPLKAGANAVIAYGRNKMYQAEQENVGTQAAHKGEILADGSVRSALRFHKTAPYRKVAKLERAAAKKSVELSYQKALAKNPKLKSNVFSRMAQKRKIKKQYEKAAREAQKAAKRAQKAGSYITRAAQAVAGFVKRHPVAAAAIVLIALLLFIFMSLFGLASGIGNSGLGGILSASYLAEDKDIDDAELAYSEWETDLQMQIANAEADHPGYDEYRYNVGDISHNPFELMAYLTSRYQDFTYSAVESDLRGIFAEQYTLSFVEEIEVRYRTEYYTDDNGDEQSREVPYNWYILNINLVSRSFTDVVSPRLTTDAQEIYVLLMETHGNRQYMLNPFDFDWLPYVSCYYGWRVHPITGVKDYHKGIDIAVPTGTPILAGHDGVVTAAAFDADGFGWYIAIAGNDGLVTKYAHCDTLLASVGQEVKQGDVIAKSGNSGNSTGPHLHLEVIKNGQYLNPLFFAEGANGSAAPGTPGGVIIPDYPGEPMGDGSFAALMEEAQKHLGKPYVFGAAGPNTFDCSGFVCYVLNNSGVASVERTTATGLFNMCTPISPENAQPGDLIFFAGTYSTPNACSHIGIYIGNGMMIHAGDPVQYASINDSYWQEHFYAFGRL